MQARIDHLVIAAATLDEGVCNGAKPPSASRPARAARTR